MFLLDPLFQHNLGKEMLHQTWLLEKFYELENVAIAHNLSKKGFDRFRYPFSPIGATFW
ncbi:MAG: hypothetical protein BWZ05_00869 [Bacteroidetes bacterium ADurb.BinA245]|nr:MAG: hypothetical protein BWZ05_00869 [Bacteroidetes bacterium ADurb.BinA245]